VHEEVKGQPTLPAVRIRRLTARNCQRRRYEQRPVRNMVMEFDWLKGKVNNRLIKRDWLNILVDMGSRVRPIRLSKCDFAVA
jgi:hypothetical protein